MNIPNIQLDSLIEGLDAHLSGNFPLARSCYEQVVSLEECRQETELFVGLLPADDGAGVGALNVNNSVILQNNDFLQAAVKVFRLAVRNDLLARVLRAMCLLDPANQQIRLELVNALINSGALLEAASEVQHLMHLSPATSGYYHGLADIYAGLGWLEARRDVLENLISLGICEDAHAHQKLSEVYLALGESEASYSNALIAITGEGLGAEQYLSLGNLFFEREDWQNALLANQHVLNLLPGNPGALNNAGNCLKQLGRYWDAEESYLEAKKSPDAGVYPLINLADLYMTLGYASESVDYFGAAIEVGTSYRDVYSNRAHAINYLSGLDEKSVFQAQTLAAEIYRVAESEQYYAPSAVSNTDGRVIRIGFVSGDFRRHSVAYFLKPLLRHINKTRFEVSCYSNVRSPDAVTAEIRSLSEHWHDITAMSDSQVAALIFKDKIDLLIDLSGHTSLHRMGIFSYRAAPIQATWLGYPNTTGLEEINYRITDEATDPVSLVDEELYTEKLLRLDGSFLCFESPEYRPPLIPTPASSNGYVTFGSFNNYSKISSQTIEMWGTILRHETSARLVLKSGSLKDEKARERLFSLLAEQGVERERVDLLAFSDSFEDHLNLYNRLDIALDTFPYNGTTTTFEALWAGVPTVSQVGEAHRSRVGKGILHHLGLDRLAPQPKDFLDVVYELAADSDALSDLRAKIYADFPVSVLTDGAGFAQRMEKAFRDMVTPA